jgi:hypothetical protein
MCPHSGFTDRHLHAQIEQLRVSVLHFVLAEEGAHHFFACRLEGDAEGLVFDVGAQTFRINFDGRLHVPRRGVVERGVTGGSAS